MRLKTKFATIFLIISAVPVSLFSFYIIYQSEKTIQRQTLDYLSMITESTESHILIFLEQQKNRVADWATDNYIRSGFSEIIETGDSDKVNVLGEYLKIYKQSIASSVLLTDILNMNGRVVVSSNKERIGHEEPNVEELEDEYSFIKAKDAKYGQVFMSGLIFEEEPGHPEIPMFHVSSPIFSTRSEEVIGVMVNHIYFNELNAALSGEGQLKLSNQIRSLGWYKNLKLYLVNHNGMVIASSPFKNENILKDKIGTPLAQGCIDENKESVGSYQNHLGVKVFGAVSCPIDQFWFLLIEVDQNDALAEMYGLKKVIEVAGLFVALIILALSLIFSRGIIRRIDQNMLVVKEIGGGNLKARVDMFENDEIADVGRGINQMAEDLGMAISKEQLLAKVVSSSAEGIMITNAGPRGPNHMIIYVNPMWEKMYGWRSEEVVDKMSPLILKSGKQDKDYYDKLWRTIMSGEVFRSDIVNKKKNGDLIEVESLILPIKSNGDDISYYVNICRDISERKDAERRRRDLDELKNKFITVISHQMRTPLNGISWSLETILGGNLGKLTEEQGNMIKSSYAAAIEIIHRIDDLINALDIEEKKIRLQIEKIYPDSLVNSFLLEFEKPIKEKKLRVVFKKSEKKPEIDADLMKIKSVIAKLLDNAIKYSNEGGEIEINIEEKNSKVYFSISDHGIGIPSDEQNKVFNKFYRATNAFTKLPDSSGLGLFIAKAIIEAHGGRIWFDSVEGRGSNFYFELPENFLGKNKL